MLNFQNNDDHVTLAADMNFLSESHLIPEYKMKESGNGHCGQRGETDRAMWQLRDNVPGDLRI